MRSAHTARAPPTSERASGLAPAQPAERAAVARAVGASARQPCTRGGPSSDTSAHPLRKEGVAPSLRGPVRDGAFDVSALAQREQARECAVGKRQLHACGGAAERALARVVQRLPQATLAVCLLAARQHDWICEQLEAYGAGQRIVLVDVSHRSTQAATKGGRALRSALRPLRALSWLLKFGLSFPQVILTQTDVKHDSKLVRIRMNMSGDKRRY